MSCQKLGRGRLFMLGWGLWCTFCTAGMLGLGHPRRRIHQQVAARRRFGERNHVADAGSAAQHGHEAVESQGDAAVRRTPVAESVGEVGKTLLEPRRQAQDVRKDAALLGRSISW